MEENPYLTSHDVMVGSSFSGAAGSIETTAAYLSTDNIPDYAIMFYQPTEHENFTQIKYGNFEAGYHNLNEIREDLMGMPFEFYVPQGPMFMSGGAVTTSPAEIELANRPGLDEVIAKEAVNEIEKAQAELTGRKIHIEVEETITLKRKRSLTITETNKSKLPNNKIIDVQKK